MKTRKNNRKKGFVGGATNIAINTTITHNASSPIPSPTNTLSINPKKRTPRRLSNTATSTKEIINITTKNINQSGKNLMQEISIYYAMLSEIKWIIKSLPSPEIDLYKKIMNSIDEDVKALQVASSINIQNTNKDKIYKINLYINRIENLLEKLNSLNIQVQPIFNKKIQNAVNLQGKRINRPTMFKTVGEHIVRMIGFCKKYTELFSTMRDRLQAFRNK